MDYLLSKYGVTSSVLPSDTPTATDHSQPAWHLIHRVGQCANDLFVKGTLPTGLTPRQYVILQIIDRNEGISQTGIVSLSGIDRSTTADIVSRLLNKKFVRRTRSKGDARKYAIRLTEEGHQTLMQANPVASLVDAETLAILSPKQQHEFLEILTKIVDHFGKPTVDVEVTS